MYCAVMHSTSALFKEKKGLLKKSFKLTKAAFVQQKQ